MVAQMLSLLVFVSVVYTGNAGAIFEEDCTGPIPESFQSDFLGNCGHYGYSSSTCDQAWDYFLTAFANKKPQDVKEKDYDNYFNTIPINIPRDKALLWDNTRNLTAVVAMMGTFLVSSHNVNSASILNDFGLGFCWCSEPGNNNYLHSDRACNTSFPTMQFWAQFSVRFAKASEGIVFFLVNGESPPAYNPKTFFGCFEVPNLNQNKVKRLVVLNVHRNGQGESCGTGTLNTLCQTISTTRIPYMCYDIIGTVEDAKANGPTLQKLQSQVTNIQSGRESSTISCSNSGGNSSGISTVASVYTILVLIFTSLFLLYLIC